MDKYIITGGAGFIGSHIAEQLSDHGYEVVVLDSLRTGFKKNLEHLNVEFIEGSIFNKDFLHDFYEDAKAIFHLAALVSIPESLQQIEKCVAINTFGIINVLEATKQNQDCKVVLSSSAANYGDSPKLPKVESMVPKLMTPYSVTKLDGEYYLKIYQEQ